MKKVLIITYYWPPAGGIAVQRCLKFAKYLRNFGWEPIIYAPSNAQYTSYDNSFIKDIPKGITVLKQPIKEPFALFKLFSGRKKTDNTNPVYSRDKKVPFIDNLAIWIRGNFFIPDARFLWIKPSVKYLKRYLKDNPVDALLTDGPPHTNTVIACKLANEMKIPWLADFQDPWTQVDYYKMFKISKWADKKHKKLEQEVFKTASKITIASPTWSRDLESIGAKNVDPIYWAYDEQDFEEVKRTKTDDKFVIGHAGLLGFDRNPEILLKVLGQLKNEVEGFGDSLLLNFAGIIDFTVKDEINKNNLSSNLVELGQVTRPEALNLIINSDLLLLPLNKADNAKGRIPGKLFECLRTRNPILVLGPSGSDVQYIVKSCEAGESFEYDDYNSIKSFVLKLYKDFQDKKQSYTSKNVEDFEVQTQVKKIAEYLDEIAL